MFTSFKFQKSQEFGKVMKKEIITLEKYAWEVNLGSE